MESLLRKAKKRLLQMHYESGVGHIGGNLSALDALLVLYHRVLQEHDEFILSKGHAAGALYAALWSAGRLSEDQLKTFHRDGTLLAAHPVPHWSKDIPFATGSLGHGVAVAGGMALGKRLQGQPGRIYCMTSDAEWQEGSTWEALIFACHHRLHNLTILVDENRLQGFGGTGDVASMEPLAAKLAGFQLDLAAVDGHDPEALHHALSQAQGLGPRVILLRTVKGHGVSFMENRMEWHYLPMSSEQFQQAITEVEAAGVEGR